MYFDYDFFKCLKITFMGSANSLAVNDLVLSIRFICNKCYLDLYCTV